MLGRMTRILVVHASVGGGHINAATAIVEALAARGETDVHRADYNDLVPAWQRGPVQAAYWWALGHMPILWRAYYRHTNRPAPTLAAHALATAGVARTIDLIAALRPDLVISTFTGGGALVGAARLRLGMHVPHISVATDYLPHRHWVRAGIDHWCAPCEAGRDALIANGAPAERITITGIPIRAGVRAAIAAPPDLRAQFGLDDRPILVAAAGARPTPRSQRMLETLAELKTPSQVLVCFPGRVPTSARVRFIAVGLTPRFPELLAGCDLLVGKAGGATVAEATAAGTPLVVCDPFPGQEEDNASWLVERGAARWASSPRELAPAVDAALAARHIHAAAARALAQPDAADRVVDLVLGSASIQRLAA